MNTNYPSALFHRESRVNYFIDENEDFLESLKVKKQEKEAEIFAAYCLIPEEKLNAIFEGRMGKRVSRSSSRTSQRISSLRKFYEGEP